MQLTCISCFQGDEIVTTGSIAWSFWYCGLTCIASLAQPRCSSRQGHALGRSQQPPSPLPSRQSPCSARLIPHNCLRQKGTARCLVQAGVRLNDGCNWLHASQGSLCISVFRVSLRPLSVCVSISEGAPIYMVEMYLRAKGGCLGGLQRLLSGPQRGQHRLQRRHLCRSGRSDNVQPVQGSCTASWRCN